MSLCVCGRECWGVGVHSTDMEPPRSCVSLYLVKDIQERQLLARGAVLCFFMLCSAWKDEHGGHKWLPLVTESPVFVGCCTNPHLSHSVPQATA